MSSTSLPSEPLLPSIPDPSVVKNLLKDSYGLTTSSLTPLNGYDDRNYHAKVYEKHDNAHLGGVPCKELFVKVVNSKDSKRPEFVECQRLVMDHLNKHGIETQEEIKNLDGNFFSQITVDQNGVEESYMVSVRTFLRGKMLADHTTTPALLYELGAYMARLQRALESFHHSFYDDFDCPWSLNNMVNVRHVLHVVQDCATKKLVLEILDSFDTDVLPKREEFRKAQIHGDPNEQNIVLQPDKNTVSGFAISGLLDFQDTSGAFSVYDLAMFCAYMMMMPSLEVPPKDAVGYILAGYQSLDNLRPAERACLRTLIACRMAMSLVYGAYTFNQNPENDYVIVTAKKGWQVMTEFWRIPKEEVEECWDKIITEYVPKQTEP